MTWAIARSRLSWRVDLEVVNRPGIAHVTIDEKRDVVGQLVELAHDVRRDEHGPTAIAHLDDLVLENCARHGIEAGGRLVEDQQRRV